MRTLSWDTYLRNPSVAAAYGYLKNITSRSIKLHPARHSASFWTGWRDEILIFARVLPPVVVHHEIVHELIHAIMMEEGYFRLTWGANTQTRGALSNELQHPEVFRRMESYGLDMSPYWGQWRPKLAEGLSRLRGRDRGQLHFHFLEVFTWFFFPVVSGDCLAQYRLFNSILYDAAEAAHKESARIGCSTPEAHRQFLASFKSHWRRYCVGHLPMTADRGRLLHLLEESEMECVRDKVNARSEQFILEHLRYDCQV